MRSGSTLENRQLTLLHSNNCIDTISPSKACSRMCHRLNWQHCGAWNKKLENALHFKLHKRPIRAENTNEMLQWLLHWWIFDGFLFFVFFCMFCSSAVACFGFLMVFYSKLGFKPPRGEFVLTDWTRLITSNCHGYTDSWLWLHARPQSISRGKDSLLSGGTS